MASTEVIGYGAAFAVFLTFYMKTMVPLRITGLIGNVCFLTYGYLDSAFPVLVVHLILLPLNAFRLRQMLVLANEVRTAVRGDLSMEWVMPYTAARDAHAGDVMFRKGDPANVMFFVVSGRFRLLEIGIDIRPGEIVGELGLLAPDQARTGTLKCVDPGRVLQITYDEVRQLYFQNPKFGFYFLQLTTQRLFKNLAELEQELASRPNATTSPQLAARSFEKSIALVAYGEGDALPARLSS
jgi:CRP/FNR family transcriptional regulator, cyclic AMP receptor protein